MDVREQTLICKIDHFMHLSPTYISQALIVFSLCAFSTARQSLCTHVNCQYTRLHLTAKASFTLITQDGIRLTTALSSRLQAEILYTSNAKML